jgi:elongation factor Ts
MGITPTQVKELRERTGVGIMDCKRALEATDGDIEAAIEHLRKQGIAKAGKRVGRATLEGVIEAYIHPGERLGVLVEINCETDFVGRNEEFRRLARDIAMQVAASNPIAVSRDQLPPDLIEREQDIYRSQARSSGKPEQVVERIVEGKMEKFYRDTCLLEQPFIKDPDRTVGDVITEQIAKIGENITVRRFARFRLGE